MMRLFIPVVFFHFIMALFVFSHYPADSGWELLTQCWIRLQHWLRAAPPIEKLWFFAFVMWVWFNIVKSDAHDKWRTRELELLAEIHNKLVDLQISRDRYRERYDDGISDLDNLEARR